MKAVTANGTPLKALMGALTQLEVKSIIQASISQYEAPEEPRKLKALTRKIKAAVHAAEMRYIQDNYSTIQ
jgi:hypothetical protein